MEISLILDFGTLYQLANALYPLIGAAEPLETILEAYKTGFERKSLDMMRSKLGLDISDDGDGGLVKDLEDALLLTETDMTLFFRCLGRFSERRCSKRTAYR